MEHIYIDYTTYWYYDPTCDIEFDERARIKDDYCPGECESHYLRIDTKEELIKALKYLIKEDELFSYKKVKVYDLIKLLNDSNLGDTFFERFKENINWYFKDERAAHIDHLIGGRTFLFLNHRDGKISLIPFYKEHKELEKYLLQYCIDEDIKVKEEWFDIKEEDIQEWRHEHNVNKLKDVLHSKKLELGRTKRRVIKLEKELEDLKINLEDLEK